MRTIVTLIACIAIPTAAAQTINRCQVNGKTVYTDQACGKTLQRTIERAEPPAPTVPRRMSDAEHNNFELAQQYDQRMAQTAAEQQRFAQAQSAQAASASDMCSSWRGEKELLLKQMRQPNSAQQIDWLKGRLRVVTDEMYRNRC